MGSVFLSFYGDWLTTVALVVILYQATGSPAGPAGYMVARIAPRILGPWLGGALADRLSPRRTMVAAMLGQAVATSALVFAHRGNALWAIYLAVAVAQFLGAMARPSQSAMIPLLVSRGRLSRANATYQLLFSTSIFVGPALGAALLVRTGPDLLFAIDAGTFAVGAVLAASLGVGGRTDQAGTRTPFASELVAGFMPALRDPVIRLIAAGNFATGLTITVTQAVLVVGAHERLGGDAAVGYLYAAVGVGGTLGGLLALRWTPSSGRLRAAIFVGILVEVAGLAGYAAAYLVVVALAVLAASSLGGCLFDVWGNTEVQRRAPQGLVGRYNATIFVALYGGMLAGAAWALATSQVLRWDVALQVSCAAMFALVIVTRLTAREPRHGVTPRAQVLR